MYVTDEKRDMDQKDIHLRVHDMVDNVGDHIFQFVDERLRLVLSPFDLAELAFPYSRKFCGFEQFLMDGGNQFAAGVGGIETFALAADVVAFEEGLDDGGTG